MAFAWWQPQELTEEEAAQLQALLDDPNRVGATGKRVPLADPARVAALLRRQEGK